MEKSDALKDLILSLPLISELNQSSPIDHLQKMLVIRGVELGIVELAQNKKLRGPIHSYVGQEASAVGVISQATVHDLFTSTHRGHGHYIARGGNITSLIDELYGLPSGSNGGHGGSMHVADLSKGLLGANGIVGGGVPIACGAALQKKLDKERGIVISFFGDGAFNQGVVMESLNIAAYMKLPILFICENNCFAQSTRFQDVSATEPVERAAGFGLFSQKADGMDAADVSNVTSSLMKTIRAQEAAGFLQIDTYRFHRHFVSERPKPRDYINKPDHDLRISRDPLFHSSCTSGYSHIEIEQLITEIQNIIVNYTPALS